MRFIDIPSDLLVPNQKAYNCSIVEHKGLTYLFYRFEPPNGNYNTELGACQLDSRWRPVDNTNKVLRLARWSTKVTTVDDPRVFVLNGKMMMVYPQGNVVHSGKDWLWATSIAIAEISGDLRITGQWMPEYGKNLNVSSKPGSSLVACEKNWSPFVYNGRFLMLYSINPMVVIEFNAQLNTTTEIQRDVAPVDLSFWKYGNFLGGGTPLVKRGDEYVGFFHSFTDDHPNKPNVRTYHVGFYAISDKPPFRLTRISRVPFMSAVDEPKRDLRGDNASWRPNCIYPCGFIERNDRVYISQGWQDCRCEIVETDWNEIEQNVVKIGDPMIDYAPPPAPTPQERSLKWICSGCRLEYPQDSRSLYAHKC